MLETDEVGKMFVINLGGARPKFRLRNRNSDAIAGTAIDSTTHTHTTGPGIVRLP